MKIFFLMLFLTSSVFAQSSYSSADQDTQNNDFGTQMDTGYVNKDAENKNAGYSENMDRAAPITQKQEEVPQTKSGKNATRKRAKTSLED